MAVRMTMFFWVMTPRILVGRYHRFGERVIAKTARFRNADHNLNSHYRENLKSSSLFIVTFLSIYLNFTTVQKNSLAIVFGCSTRVQLQNMNTCLLQLRRYKSHYTPHWQDKEIAYYRSDVYIFLHLSCAERRYVRNVKWWIDNCVGTGLANGRCSAQGSYQKSKGFSISKLILNRNRSEGIILDKKIIDNYLWKKSI
jgi:hypothetical protein